MKTKEQLVLEWLEMYPEDLDDPDLEEMALAGTILLKCGSYVHQKQYEILIKELKLNE